MKCGILHTSEVTFCHISEVSHTAESAFSNLGDAYGLYYLRSAQKELL